MLRGNYCCCVETSGNYRWDRQAVDATVGVGLFDLLPASQRTLPRQQSPLRVCCRGVALIAEEWQVDCGRPDKSIQMLC